MAITETNLARLHTAIVAAGVVISGVSIAGEVTPPSLQAAAQPTIDAFDGSAASDATFGAQQAKTAATAGIDNGQLIGGSMEERLIRALALVVLDEVNILRAAVIPALTARTTAQVVNAIKAKIAATAE